MLWLRKRRRRKRRKRQRRPRSPRSNLRARVEPRSARAPATGFNSSSKRRASSPPFWFWEAAARCPHPCVTAPPLSPEERPFGRVAKDERSKHRGLLVRDGAPDSASALPGERLLTIRNRPSPFRTRQPCPERGKAAGEGAAQPGHHLWPRHDAVANGCCEQAVDREYRKRHRHERGA